LITNTVLPDSRKNAKDGAKKVITSTSFSSSIKNANKGGFQQQQQQHESKGIDKG